MPTGTTWDQREFNRAMDQAVVWSSRDRQTVANSKLKDWMIKSLKSAPRAKRGDIQRVIENPRLITWWLNQTFGRGNWTKEEWPIAMKALRRRLSSIGFVRSGFAKAQRKLPQGDSSRPGKQRLIGGAKLYNAFGRVVRAFVRRARPKERALSEATITYEQPASTIGLSRILQVALSSGQRGMVRDTKRHIERKMKKTFKRVSV